VLVSRTADSTHNVGQVGMFLGLMMQGASARRLTPVGPVESIPASTPGQARKAMQKVVFGRAGRCTISLE
jgi:hypothetical protein